MATIRSIFKMQDNATKTFDKVSSAIDKVIDKADALSAKTSNMDAGVKNINPALTQAISKYQGLINNQEQLNEKIYMMNRQEKLLQTELAKEKESYRQNDKAILGIENRLMNLRHQKERLIGKSDELTNKIIEQAGAVVEVEKNTRNIKPPVDDVGNGFSKWQTKLITFNQTLQAVKSIARGVQSVMNFSDNITLGTARVGLINDGLQTTEELQRKIFDSAQRSRGSYNDMAASISKLGLLAGDAFSSNDEMIAFSEMMNKSFKVSGAGPQEISSATYQLTQAMAAGRLQGDEFRSIMENAPMLADAIAKYMGKSKGELRELSREGKITSDVIKAAMFTAADDINAQYEQMPKTFADVTQSIKNNFQYEMQDTANRISELLNNEKIIKMVEGINVVISKLGDITVWVVDKIAIALEFLYDHIYAVMGVLGIIAAYTLIPMIPVVLGLAKALFLKAAAWAAAHWQMLTAIGIFLIAYVIFQNTQDILVTLAWAILMVAGAFAIWNVVQWALNGALYACPIVWIIVLIIAVIAAIYLLINWILKLTDSTNSALGIIMGALFTAAAFIYNIFAAVVNFVIDAFGVLWNFIASFVNFFANVFVDPVGTVERLFHDLVDTVLGLLESLASVIDTIFGSNLSGAVRGWRDNLGEFVDKKYGEKNEVMAKFDSSKHHLGRWEYGDAWDSGLKFGNDLSAKIGEFDPASALSGILGGNDADKYGGGYDYQSLLDANGNVPVDVKDGEINISDEDLKMLKDIATREYMLNYKHITPNVNIEFGDIRETADVNQVRDALSRMMEEELAELYVVEEA